MKKAIFFAIVIFILSLFLLPKLIPSRCRDGWKSHSIGRIGACSHHGGVGFNPSGIISITLGIATFFIMRRK